MQTVNRQSSSVSLVYEILNQIVGKLLTMLCFRSVRSVTLKTLKRFWTYLSIKSEIEITNEGLSLPTSLNAPESSMSVFLSLTVSQLEIRISSSSWKAVRTLCCKLRVRSMSVWQEPVKLGKNWTKPTSQDVNWTKLFLTYPQFNKLIF